MSTIEQDQLYMKRALDLAKQGFGRVSPNPMVGAVLVKGGKVIGEGYHGFYGGPHAEVAALASCEESPEVATLYVTLEPCCHYGKTPPCTEAVIAAGIKRVVVAMLDPNPLVAGRGIELLQMAGIEVSVGILEAESRQLNEVFVCYISEKRPYAILKSAMSLDGKIATASGQSQWITSEAARRHGHETRARVKAIMTGIGTVLADDPQLTCRLIDETGAEKLQANPIRVVADTALRTPLTSKLVQTAKETPLWLICGAGAGQIDGKRQALEAAGAKIIEVSVGTDGHIDLNEAMNRLAEAKIDSLLIEGGGQFSDGALRAGIVDEINFYQAPLLIGGLGAKGAIGGLGADRLSEAVRLKPVTMEAIGPDWLIRAKIDKQESGR